MTCSRASSTYARAFAIGFPRGCNARVVDEHAWLVAFIVVSAGPYKLWTPAACRSDHRATSWVGSTRPAQNSRRSEGHEPAVKTSTIDAIDCGSSWLDV